MCDYINFSMIIYYLFIAYLAPGIGVWLAIDPNPYRDFVLRAFMRKTGRLPNPIILFLACSLGVIAVWPKIVMTVLDARFGVRR